LCKSEIMFISHVYLYHMLNCPTYLLFIKKKTQDISHLLWEYIT